MRKLLRFGRQIMDRSRAGCWFMAIFALASSAFSANCTASLDGNSVVVGEDVTLTLKFEDGQPQELSNLPQLDGLRIASSVNRSISSVFGGGGQTTVYSYSVVLEPTRVG